MYMGFYPVQRQNAGYYPVQNQTSGGQHARRSGGNRTHRSGAQAQQAANLVGHHVKINRGGPDSVEGTLIAVPGDYLVLSGADGVVYVNGSHVKSITEGNRSQNRSRSVDFVSASSFQSLLSKLRLQFVQINRGGPEKTEGFLAEINSDFLLLIVGREFVRVPLFHIKTISVTSNKSGNNKSGSNNNNKSGGNKSGSNKSGNKSGNRSGGRSGGKSGSGGRSGGGRSGGRSGSGGRGGSGRSGR